MNSLACNHLTAYCKHCMNDIRYKDLPIHTCFLLEKIKNYQQLINFYKETENENMRLKS